MIAAGTEVEIVSAEHMTVLFVQSSPIKSLGRRHLTKTEFSFAFAGAKFIRISHTFIAPLLVIRTEIC